MAKSNSVQDSTEVTCTVVMLYNTYSTSLSLGASLMIVCDITVG